MARNVIGLDPTREWEYENGFYLTSHVTRVAKLLAQFEIYKSIIGLPGHIVECGVFKGSSFVRLATFREVLESPYSRRLVGFDAFGRFPRAGLKRSEERRFVDQFERAAGQGIKVSELHRVMKRKNLVNYELVRGDVSSQVPAYLRAHPAFRVALLHVDLDTSVPTSAVLDAFYCRVVQGGVIMLDDYGAVAGATSAIDEFMRQRGLVASKPSTSHIPSYIVKTEAAVPA